MAEKSKEMNKGPESRNTGVLAEVPKAKHGKASWRNLFGMFIKSSDGSMGPSISSKLQAGSDNRRPAKKEKKKKISKVGLQDRPCSSKLPEDPLALKVTLPSGISNSDLSVSFEVESSDGKNKIKKKDRSKMYLTCVRKTEKISEFEGKLVLPPETDIDKLAKMPLYFVDTEGNPLKSDDDDYTVFQPVKNALSKNVDIGLKIKDVYLKVKLEKLNFNQKSEKIPKYLSCCFVTASQCPPPNPHLHLDEDFDFYDDDDEVEEGEELATEIIKKDVEVKQEGVYTKSSEKIVADILQNVMSTLPLKEQFTQYNYKNPDCVSKKESTDSILPRSSCTTMNIMDHSEISSYYIDSVPQNSPNERIIQTNVRQESLCQGDEYYNYSKQLADDKEELLEHQRRVEELDKTLQVLQNARSKLTSFLDPTDITNIKMIDPEKIYQILPLAGVPPVSYLCAAQSNGNSNVSVEMPIPMEMVSKLGEANDDMEENSKTSIQYSAQCTSSVVKTLGDIPLADNPSVLIVKAQTKLEEELQKFREKDKSKSNIEIIPQHKYPRSITTLTPKMKLNTIQNLYYSPKFTVEFNAATYEGLNALYDKRYGNKNNEALTSRESDITYNIVENDIKSMIHDLLKETWTIKETALENFGKDKKHRSEDDLISLVECEVVDRESPTNCVLFCEMQHGESAALTAEILQTNKEETEFPINTSTSTKPYQVNYCIINNPQKSPMVTVNKLNAYQGILNDNNRKDKFDISSGLTTNISNEIYGFDNNRSMEIQFCADDNVSDKKNSGTNETFESQYSKGYNVLVAEMPIDKTKTKFILNTAQIAELRDDEDGNNDDDESDQDVHQPSEASITNRSALKSTKFADINTTKNISETDADLAETVINTVYATSPDVMAISSFNSESLWEPTLINHTIPVLQSFSVNNDDETVIRETDLTKKNVSLPIIKHNQDAISQQIVTEKKSVTISHKSKYSSRSRSAYLRCHSSSSTLNAGSSSKSTQTIITLKKEVPLISDSDSEGIRIVQPNPLEESASHIALKPKKPLEEINPIAGTSRITDIENNSILSISHRSLTSEDYYADTDNLTISLPNLRYKRASTEELNTQEEIDEIELNVEQNDILNESRSKFNIQSDMSFELNMDESSSYISTQSSSLLTEDEKESSIKKNDSKLTLQ